MLPFLTFLLGGFIALSIMGIAYLKYRKHERLIRDEVIHLKAEKQFLEQQLAKEHQELQLQEKRHQESLRVAKEAMFESGQEIFRKEAESLHGKTLEHLQKLHEGFASLTYQVKQSDDAVHLLKSAFLTPKEAGAFTELGLENTLTSFGLKSGIDFITQASIDQAGGTSKLRPDAIVFLPGGYGIVIDCKASKFFIELAEARGTEQEAQVKKQLLGSMKEHLKSLSSKAYHDATMEHFKGDKTSREVQKLLSVMYVFQETNVETLLDLEPNLRTQCQDANIILAGPTGLAGLLTLARLEIAHSKQRENEQIILTEMGVFLSRLSTLAEHAAKLGRSLESVSKQYLQFAGSFNNQFLPKARQLQKLGVEVPINKSLSTQIPQFQLVHNEQPLVAVQAEECEALYLESQEQ